MANRMRGAPLPAADPRPTYDVVGPVVGRDLDVTLLADGLYVVLTHWVWAEDGRTGSSRPCWHHEGECQHCHRPTDALGFGAAYDHGQRRRIVLRLGKESVRTMLQVLGSDGAWQGVRVRLALRNEGQGRRLLCERVGPEMPPMAIPPHDIDASVCLVLRCQRLPQQGPTAGEVAAPEGGAS